MVGQTISHYRILEKLGEGGMGVVYKAEDTRLKRVVALKFLPHHVSVTPEEEARFLQEAQAAATLNHPNICTIHDIKEHEGQQFIVMECVEGMTLRKKITSVTLKPDDAIAYAVQIGEALQEAHSKGIVHRDIKADNIMVNAKNQVKVMDFGLAKLKGSLKLTKASSTVGTLAYMAPEQIQGGEVDGRSDIFSFGVVLFEMLTGRMPFRGEHDAAIMYSILNEESDTVQKYRQDASSELDRIIHRALEKDPADRYQHVDDMVSELRRMQKQSARVVRPSSTDGTVKPSSSTGDGQDAAKSSGPSKRTIMFGVMGIVLTVAAILLYVFNSRQQAIDSLAVLPFVNATTDPNAEYLSEGITENITNKLSQLSKLRVVPRSMVAKYKGKDPDPREVGRDLNVSAVLTGKVTQRGDVLIVQAELIDINNVSQLWGEQYNKKLSDIIPVQDDIARKVAEKLRTEISGEERNTLASQHAVNSEAYQLYLKGLFHSNKRTAEGARKGIEFFEQAIRIDPGFPLAYTGLSEAYLVAQFDDLKPRDGMPKVKTNSIKALELDPKLAEAHATLATVKAYYDYDFLSAEESFRRAIELNPNYPRAHHWFAEFLIYMGRFDEGLAEYQRASELDPASLVIASDVGNGYFVMRDYDRSIQVLKKAIEMDPNFVRSHFYIMDPYRKKGMNDEAFKELIIGLTAQGDSASRIEELKKRYAAEGFKGVAKLTIERAQRSPNRVLAPSIIAFITLGNKDKALDLLEQAYEERSSFCATLKTYPIFDDLRNEPRFIALMKKMGFEK